MSRTLPKFGVPFDKATPLVHFPKRLKRPRNTAGHASRYDLQSQITGEQAIYPASFSVEILVDFVDQLSERKREP